MFSIEGIISNQQQKITYTYESGIGKIDGDLLIMLAVEDAMESSDLTGPVGQYLERDINNPLAVLSVINECFEAITGYDGDLPEADPMPEGAR